MGLMDTMKSLGTKKAGPKQARIEELERELEAERAKVRVLNIQNARLGAERVALQELSRSMQNLYQAQSIMVADLINNMGGMLTEDDVKKSIRDLACSVRAVKPEAVDNVISSLAALDHRTQHAHAVPRQALFERAKVVYEDGNLLEHKP